MDLKKSANFVCRFLGHVRQLLNRAIERGIPLSLIYLLRDPRATVMSQVCGAKAHLVVNLCGWVFVRVCCPTIADITGM